MSKGRESDDFWLVDNKEVGDFGCSSTGAESSCSNENVLLSLWMCSRFFGTDFGLELTEPVAELGLEGG